MNSGLLLVTWLFLVTVSSLIPVPEVDVGPQDLDKLIHFIIYGITAILFLRVFLLWYHNIRMINSVSIVASSLYGFIMELIQSFLPYRTFSLSDMLWNLLGAITFVTLWNMIPFTRNS